MPSAAPPQADVAGPPRTELEELQIKANQVTDEVSKSFRIDCNQNLQKF